MLIRGLATLSLAFVALGCANRQSQLVGTWKARPVPVASSPNLRDVSESAMLGLFTQNMQIEFTHDGRFKMSQAIGWAEGTYIIEDDKVKLKFNTLAPTQALVLRFGKESKTIEIDREFSSDANVVFEKQP